MISYHPSENSRCTWNPSIHSLMFDSDDDGAVNLTAGVGLP